MENFKFIDLFCGIGGFHQAMSSLGGECVFACDIDPFCQITYYRNYGIKPAGDITKVDASDIPAHDVLCGGFPCQAFSVAGKRLGFSDPTKGTLFFDIVRIIKHHKPKYLLLENVRNLASHDDGNTWKVIHEQLTAAGYNVSPTPVIFSPHFLGVPQHRDRVFIMGIRKDLGELPPFFYDRRKAPKCDIDTILQDDSEIPNMRDYRLKKWEIELVDLWNGFLEGIRPKVKKLPMFPVTDLFMHHTLDAFDFYSLEPQKAQTARRNVELYNAAHEFIDGWLVEAYKNPKFKGAKRMLEWHAGNVDTPNLWDTIMQFRQSGIRARPANYFPTLTAVLQLPIIGKRKRKITPRECARLQSFPDTFLFDDTETQAYKQFGNSVNVDVVRLFAKFLLGDVEARAQLTAPSPQEMEEQKKAHAPARHRPLSRPTKGVSLSILTANISDEERALVDEALRNIRSAHRRGRPRLYCTLQELYDDAEEAKKEAAAKPEKHDFDSTFEPDPLDPFSAPKIPRNVTMRLVDSNGKCAMYDPTLWNSPVWTPPENRPWLSEFAEKHVVSDEEFAEIRRRLLERKGKRGRPRKYPLDAEAEARREARRRNRSANRPAPDPNAPKRKVGRPRKYPVDMPQSERRKMREAEKRSASEFPDVTDAASILEALKNKI